MSAEQIKAAIIAGSILIEAGIATFQQVRSVFASLFGKTMSEADENAILAALNDDDARRVIMARHDVQQAIDDGATP